MSDKPQAHRQNFKRVSMLRLRLSYLYLGQSSSKTPSMSKMKTWWQYWCAIILLQEHVLNLYQFLNVNKEIPFIIFPLKKKQMTFAFLTIVYYKHLLLWHLLLYSVYQRGAFLEAKKRKNLKNNGKKLPLKTFAKTLCKSQYCICTLV